jgi:hypothetical protein
MKRHFLTIFLLFLLLSCHKEDPNKRLQIAIQFAEKNNYPKAIETLDQLIKEYPKSAPPYLHRGVYIAV